MRDTRSFIAVTAATGLLIALSGQTASAAIDKCQKAIAKEHAKLEAKMVKALNKCGDNYRKAIAKGDPLSSVTGKCNDALDKAFNIGNAASAIAKAKVKLNDLLGGKCTDPQDLAALGHLSQVIFGDRWQRLVLVSAWKVAYENALGANANLVNIMQELVEAGGCALCSAVKGPPCHTHNCILAPGSGGPVNISTGVGQVTLLTTNLTGAVPVGACDVPSVIPAGEFAILGVPNRGINPVLNVLPGIHVCVTGFRTEGYVNCIGAAGPPKVNTDICVDHIVEEVGGTVIDGCETGAPGEVCQPDVPDTFHALAPNQQNGGACLNLSTSPGVAGDAFFIATTRIQVVQAAEMGGDGLPCTLDDVPATVTAAATIPQTTGTATARVIEPQANAAAPDLTVGPLSGNPFANCNVLSSSDLSGGESVSAAAAVHGLPGPLDPAFSTRLICQ
jgi:hypothetical protein